MVLLLGLLVIAVIATTRVNCVILTHGGCYSVANSIPIAFRGGDLTPSGYYQMLLDTSNNFGISYVTYSEHTSTLIFETQLDDTPPSDPYTFVCLNDFGGFYACTADSCQEYIVTTFVFTESGDYVLDYTGQTLSVYNTAYGPGVFVWQVTEFFGSSNVINVLLGVDIPTTVVPTTLPAATTAVSHTTTATPTTPLATTSSSATTAAVVATASSQTALDTTWNNITSYLGGSTVTYIIASLIVVIVVFTVFKLVGPGTCSVSGKKEVNIDVY